MGILSFIFSELGCPECELNLGETFLKKKGLASCLLLTCKNCGYSKDILQFQMIIPFTLMSELFIA